MPAFGGIRTIPIVFLLAAIAADCQDHATTLGMLSRNLGNGKGHNPATSPKALSCFECTCGMNEMHLRQLGVVPRFAPRTAAFEEQARAANVETRRAAGVIIGPLQVAVHCRRGPQARETSSERTITSVC